MQFPRLVPVHSQSLCIPYCTVQSSIPPHPIPPRTHPRTSEHTFPVPSRHVRAGAGAGEGRRDPRRASVVTGLRAAPAPLQHQHPAPSTARIIHPSISQRSQQSQQSQQFQWGLGNGERGPGNTRLSLLRGIRVSGRDGCARRVKGGESSPYSNDVMVARMPCCVAGVESLDGFDPGLYQYIQHLLTVKNQARSVEG
ncbi:hypothetical protein BO86DRAFT_75700 [Aspergillus japonicus CBS 114.51]|uniref:Uncharacterized protein n=1 Tax=Aspergillus japonicus CBS 114.51 TaxID=1448312 RepID=A0A8T8XFP5_ASPJA|nr:hypothetical protein BO86DRAFT_75700 [Aspergillus japonicus CBS 114.51]RAH86995.1 hypothetical protein BO86DRAFT_75700 [Aspergillus japonicus CBS 114.51]